MYVPARVATRHFNVSPSALRKWDAEGKIKTKLTEGGHRRYFINTSNDKKLDRQKICYARVSSRKQAKDLDTQIKFLSSKFPKHTIISDIGSATNPKRKGLQTILEQVCNEQVEEIVVAHRDRLDRFAFEYIKYICGLFHTKIIVLDNSEKKDTDKLKEFTDDIIAIITSFTARYYGSRKYFLHKKDKNISKPKTT